MDVFFAKELVSTHHGAFSSRGVITDDKIRDLFKVKSQALYNQILKFNDTGPIIVKLWYVEKLSLENLKLVFCWGTIWFDMIKSEEMIGSEGTVSLCACS